MIKSREEIAEIRSNYINYGDFSGDSILDILYHWDKTTEELELVKEKNIRLGKFIEQMIKEI